MYNLCKLCALTNIQIFNCHMLEYETFVKKVLHRYSPVSNKSVSLLLSISRIQNLKKGDLLLDIGKISKEKHMLYKGAIVSYFINNTGDLYHKNIFLKQY